MEPPSKPFIREPRRREPMKKVTLGRTGLKVSRVGIGGIPIQRPPVQEAVKVIHRALDLGINLIDTSIGYGDSELRIGQALKGRRDQVIIATKGSWRGAEATEHTIQGSLHRLQVDHIDLWQFHNIPTPVEYEKFVADGSSLAAAHKAQDSGKVLHVGFSTHNLDVALRGVESGLFETVQFPFDFISDEAAAELIPLAKRHSVGFIGMKPFAGGNITDARLALGWLLRYPSVVPDPGVERVKEVEEIVRIVNNPPRLTDSDMKQIESIKAELGKRFCRQCLYCMPCPHGVNIWMTNITRKMHRLWPEEEFYKIMEGPLKSAENCVQCGECEAKCPYGLPIRDMIQDSLVFYRQLQGDR
jgi:predicted aldo/keto reductase-like oxidoreductase